MLLTHAPRRGSGNSCVVRVQIHETGTAAWIAHLQLCGSYRSTATTTTRDPSILPSTPSRRRASARRRVHGVGLSRSIPHRLHVQGARSTCCWCLDARRLREAAPVARGREVRLRAALRAPELVSAGPRRTSRRRRVVRGPGRAPRRAGGTGARRRVRRDGRVADARRAAGAGHRGGSRRPRAASSQRRNAEPRRRRSLYQHAPGVDGARAPARRRRRPGLGGTHAPYV